MVSIDELRTEPPAYPETPILGKGGVMSGNTSRRYPPLSEGAAVRMFTESRPDLGMRWEAMGKVAGLPGVSTAETVRKWVR